MNLREGVSLGMLMDGSGDTGRDFDEACQTCVIIPVFNEAEVIAETINGLTSLGVHVVVVDDGSTDGTLEKLEGLPVTVLRHIVNLGQGAALATGIQHAVGLGVRFIVTFDADGQHVAKDVPRLVRRLKEGNFDVVLGSRFLGEAPGMTRMRRWLLKGAVWFTRLNLRLPLTDTHNGLRTFRAEIAGSLQLTQNGMAHASEFLQKMKTAGLRFTEIPTTVKYSKYSSAKGQSALGAVDILYEIVFKKLIG